MSRVVSLDAARARRLAAEREAETAPVLDEILQRLGPDGWLVVDAHGRVVDCSEPSRGS